MTGRIAISVSWKVSRRDRRGRLAETTSANDLAMSETILILAVGTVVLAILFGARIVMRAIGGEATQDGSAASGGNGPSSSDVPGVIALPPFIFLGFLVAATVLEAVIPLPVLAAQPFRAGGLRWHCAAHTLTRNATAAIKIALARSNSTLMTAALVAVRSGCSGL